jgi:Uma2 family endonuclease
MPAATTQCLTFEEFERLPDQPGKLELLQGELIELPPAKLRHNEIAHRVFLRLLFVLAEVHARGAAGNLGKAFHEMGYRIGKKSWLQPDVSITHAGQESDDYFIGAPALVVEVISEGKTAAQIDGKIQDYLADGALEVWVLYPNRRHMWIYKPDGIAEQHAAPFQSQLLGGATIDITKFLQD